MFITTINKCKIYYINKCSEIGEKYNYEINAIRNKCKIWMRWVAFLYTLILAFSYTLILAFSCILILIGYVPWNLKKNQYIDTCMPFQPKCQIKWENAKIIKMNKW